MITVLAASAAAGPKDAASAVPASAVPASYNAHLPQLSTASSTSRFSPTIQIAAAPPARAQSAVRGQEGAVIRASMSPEDDSSWAGPVSKSEMSQAPRKLSDQELNQLRQDIRRAGEEVYEPYRQQHR
jgi:hypothetical protein